MPVWRTRNAELTPERTAPGGGTPSRVTWRAAALCGRFSRRSDFCQVLVGLLWGRGATWGRSACHNPAAEPRVPRFTAVSPSAELATASPLGRDPAWRADFSTPIETSPPPTALSHLYHSTRPGTSFIFDLKPAPRHRPETRGRVEKTLCALRAMPFVPAPRWPPRAAPRAPRSPPLPTRTQPERPPIPHTWASSRSTFSCIISLSRSREKPGRGGSGAAAAEPPRAPSMAASRAWRSLVRTPRYTQEAAASADSRTGSAEQHGPARRGQRSPPQPSRPAAPRLLPSMLLHPSAAAAFISFPPPPMEATNLQTKIIARN